VSKLGRRRGKRAEGNTDMKTFYAVFGTVAVIGLGLLGFTISSKRLGLAVSIPVDIEGMDEPGVLRQLIRGVSQGPEDAPITIIEFSDFQCPSCSFFAQMVKPRLDEELIASGQAKFVYYDLPLVSIHPNAFLAARAARCAEDQDQFWNYHDELYRRQARWAPLQNPSEALVELAEEMGMDARGFRTCLNSDKHAELISANLRFAESLGIPGTPTVLISTDGQTSRAAPGFDYESIIATVEAMTGSEIPDSGEDPDRDRQGGGG